MNKIGKAELERAITAALNVRSAINYANTILERAYEEARVIMEDVQEDRNEVAGILSDAATEAQEYADDRSEAWQEGERGSAYADWIGDLERLGDEASEDDEFPELTLIAEPDWIGEINQADFAEFNP